MASAEVSDLPAGAFAGDHGPALRMIDAATLCRLVRPREAIELVDAAMRRLSSEAMVAPERWAVSVAAGGSIGLMPGSDPAVGCFGIKVLSLFEQDARGCLPGHQGLMLLFDRDTGRPLAIIDAAALTGLRTAAASAVATRALARDDARTLALIGTGAQARWHAAVIPLVRPIDEIRLWNRSPETARRFARHCPDGIRVVVLESLEGAIAGADIVCTLTHSSTPIVRGEWLNEGQHLNLVGASTADAREIDDAAVARSRFVADSRANALSQAGELLSAIRAGVVDRGHIAAEIGDILAGRADARRDPREITAYKSLGHVVQDLAVASAALSSAEQTGAGIAVPWRQL